MFSQSVPWPNGFCSSEQFARISALMVKLDSQTHRRIQIGIHSVRLLEQHIQRFSRVASFIDSNCRRLHAAERAIILMVHALVHRTPHSAQVRRAICVECRPFHSLSGFRIGKSRSRWIRFRNNRLFIFIFDSHIASRRRCACEI